MRPLRKYVVRLAIMLPMTVVLAQGLLLGINSAQAGTITLGVRLEQQSVSRLSDSDIKKTIDATIRQHEYTSVTIHAEGYSEKITARQLGARYSEADVEKKLHAVGKTGTLWQRVIEQDRCIVTQCDVSIGNANVDQTVTKTYLDRIGKTVSKNPEDAHIIFKDGKAQIVPDQKGVVLDQARALHILTEDTNTVAGQIVDLPLTHPSAEVTTTILSPTLTKVQNIVAQPLVLQAEKQTVTISPDQLFAMIKITVDHPADGGAAKVDIGFTQQTINTKLDELSQKVDKAAKPTIVSGSDVVQQGTTGTRLDGQHAKVTVIASLIARQQSKSTDTSTTPKTTNVPKPVPVPSLTPQPSSTDTSATNQSSPSVDKTAPKTPDKPVNKAGDKAPDKSAAPVVLPVDHVDPPTITKKPEPTPIGQFPAYTPTPTGAKGNVTLTFDDGPNGTYTNKILDILKTNHVHTIFFLVGKNTENYPDVAKRIVAEGHTVGNHSFTHSNLATLSESAVTDEIKNTQASIARITTITPHLFRPPYGSSNNTVRAVVDKEGLETMMWSVDPRDWSSPGASVITKRILDDVGPGSNILLHVLHEQTVTALQGIIDGIKAKNLAFN